jgi:hypothetical protein
VFPYIGAADQHGDTTVKGDHKVVRSMVMGCVLASGENVAGAVQAADTLGAPLRYFMVAW